MAELKVTITDERGNSTTTTTTVNQETTDPTKATKTATPKTPEAKENDSKSSGMAIAAMVASKTFNYVTSNVGKFTGNSVNQNRVNNVQQVAGIAAMAYVNPYLVAANVAMTAVTTGIDIAYENKWNKRESDLKLAKAGYNSSGEVVGRRH